MLLNLSIFMWFGAVCPWDMFVHNQVIPIYRLIVIGVLILLFRRVPIVYAMHWKIPQVEEKQQALFVGFFGPIGVSAVFYLYVTLEFLKAVTVDGVVREDAARLGEVMTVVIWFLAICSIVSYSHQPCAKRHKLTIPDRARIERAAGKTRVPPSTHHLLCQRVKSYRGAGNIPRPRTRTQRAAHPTQSAPSTATPARRGRACPTCVPSWRVDHPSGGLEDRNAARMYRTSDQVRGYYSD